MSKNSPLARLSTPAFSLLILLTAALQAQVLERSPLSGGVLAARAVRAGWIQLHGGGMSQPSPLSLTCSPTPCLLPNVQASEGGMPVNTNPIAVNPSNPGQLLTGGDDYNCSSFQGFFSSSDGGTTWNHTCLSEQPNSMGEGDPILGYDLNNVAYAGALEAPPGSGAGGRVVLSSSTNNGITWSIPVTVIGAQLGYAADMPWLEVDDNATSPNKNALYVSSTQVDASGNSQIWVSHSADGGKTWASKPVDTEQSFPNELDQFSNLGVGADGTVYVTWQRCSATGPFGDCAGTAATMFLSKSTDGGNTWSAAVTVAQVTLAPDPKLCCFYGELPNTFEPVSNIPVNAVFGRRSTAKVYVAFYNWTGSQMQVEVATSTDGGNTFSAPVRVSTSNTGDQFFQWISVAKNGKIGVTWLDRRNDPANISYQSFFATSTNGTIFTTNRALSSTLSNPNNDGFNGFFMGVYRTHVWVGKAIYAAWMDTRTGNCQAEVGGVQF